MNDFLESHRDAIVLLFGSVLLAGWFLLFCGASDIHDKHNENKDREDP